MNLKADAEILLCHVLQKNRAFILAHPELQLTETEQSLYQTLLTRREQGEPIAYLTRKKGFWKHDFCVTPATLIPRPETELLVETALSVLDTAKPTRILDLGTGSGAIALSLALESPYWQLIASDQSLAALTVARQNAKQLQAKNVTFIESDWLSQIPAYTFDLIISNPPYIAENDRHLSEGDLRFEPQQALVSGKEGLDAIRSIIEGAGRFLNHSGMLMLEHGFDQKQAVQQLFEQAGFREIKTLPDLQGWPRVTLGTLLADTKGGKNCTE